MKGFAVMLSVFLILVSFVIIEETYVKNTSETLYSELKEENIKSQDDLNKIIDKWYKKEKILKLFINHKELEKITLDLITTQNFYENNSDEFYKAYLLRTREEIKRMPHY